MPLISKRRSSVVRRIHLSFMIAATLPLVALAAISYFMVSEQLQGRALREAHNLAKDIGMAIYDRLKFVNDELLILNGRDPSPSGPVPSTTGLDLGERTGGLFRISPGSGIVGDLFLTDRQREGLVDLVAQADAQKSLLLTLGEASQQRLFLLVGGAAGRGEPSWLGAELNTHYLWDTTDVSERVERVCVLDADELPVFCNRDGTDAWLSASTEMARNRAPPQSLSFTDDEPMLTAVWSLFLKPHYQFERWTVIVGVPKAEALASIRAFDRIFLSVALVAALLAFVLGSRMIRSNLKPLARLGTATRELAEGRFSHRVGLDSGDEFQQLGDAFDSMASQIGQQFNVLETLAQLDRSLQTASSLPQAIEAGMQALEGLIGPRRCALLCHEKWEASNTLWYTRFASSNIAQAECSSNLGLGAATRSGSAVDLIVDDTAIGLLGAAPADLLQRIPVVHVQHVEAEIVLSDPQPDELPFVNRVIDVLTTTLNKLVMERRMRYQARHDWLTGLPNRSHLHELFNEWVGRAEEGSVAIGMLLLNLDRFKQVNDARGHSAGDCMLKAVAQRLRAMLPADCVLGRIAGDELVVMFSSDDHYAPTLLITELAGQINAELDRPFNVVRSEIRLSASMGAAVFPRHGDSFEMMLQSLDAALRAAKAARPGSLLMFSTGMRAALAGRMDLEQALKEAVENNELVMHYQPVVDSRSRKVVSAEALMRWERPGVGLVMPSGFIEVAEQSGLIVEFGAWALAETCRQLRAWRQRGYAIDTVAVNVSGVQLADVGFELAVQAALQESGLEPRHLTLEVTESALIGNFEESAACLLRLRELGVKILVDDFGTGYASLKYLKMLPVDGLKIDRLFVKDLPDSPRDAAIIAAVVSLAQASGLKLVAEGINTKAQAEFLRDAGVRNFQGFLFDRGLPAGEFEQRLCRESADQVAGAMTA